MLSNSKATTMLLTSFVEVAVGHVAPTTSSCDHKLKLQSVVQLAAMKIALATGAPIQGVVDNGRARRLVTTLQAHITA